MSKEDALQLLLEQMLGTRNVYFQPPENVQLQYPCIVYQRQQIDTRFANDRAYLRYTKYQVVLIDKDPDSTVISLLLTLPMCSHDRHYTKDNMNHDAFTLFA